MEGNPKSVVPLINFDSDERTIRLNDKLSITHIESPELENLLEEITSDVTSYVNLLGAKYVIENRNITHSGKDEEDVVLALRLLKPGDVLVLAAFYLDERNRVSLRIYEDLNRRILPSTEYFLKSRETTDLIELWKKVRHRTTKSHLEFPTYKFMESYENVWYEDKIVDYMVAFESLTFYKRNKAIQPAGEVIGIAAGMLLGKNHKERTKIKERMKTAYELRNAKVHGNIEKLSKFENIKKLSMDVEDYLRKALRRLIRE